jgi:hypothetical protein
VGLKVLEALKLTDMTMQLQQQPVPGRHKTFMDSSGRSAMWYTAYNSRENHVKEKKIVQNFLWTAGCDHG